VSLKAKNISPVEDVGEPSTSGDQWPWVSSTSLPHSWVLSLVFARIPALQARVSRGFLIRFREVPEYNIKVGVVRFLPHNVFRHPVAYRLSRFLSVKTILQPFR
jgi:hypothetical protein